MLRLEVKILSFFFQSSMNLPPDKLELLSQYDNEKKWELVCDQVSTFNDLFSVGFAIKPQHDVSSSRSRAVQLWLHWGQS